MDSDLFLTIGIILAILTLPVLLSAWVEGRVPRLGAILIIAAGGLFVTAMTQHSVTSPDIRPAARPQPRRFHRLCSRFSPCHFLCSGL